MMPTSRLPSFSMKLGSRSAKQLSEGPGPHYVLRTLLWLVTQHFFFHLTYFCFPLLFYFLFFYYLITDSFFILLFFSSVIRSMIWSAIRSVIRSAIRSAIRSVVQSRFCRRRVSRGIALTGPLEKQMTCPLLFSMTSRINSFVSLFTLTPELKDGRQTKKNSENHSFYSLAMTAMFSTGNSLAGLTERLVTQADSSSNYNH